MKKKVVHKTEKGNNVELMAKESSQTNFIEDINWEVESLLHF